MNEKINIQIERTLQSIDGTASAEPKPYLLTRINAALQQSNMPTIWEKIAVFIKQPVVAIATILIVLFANVFVLVNHNSDTNLAAQSVSYKDDFAVNATSIYDVENLEP